MAAGETLGLNAGKNLRLKREANTNNFTFALDSNLKDLDSVHTKEIKLGESNNPISLKMMATASPIRRKVEITPT